MQMEIVILHEVSQTEEDTLHVSLICRTQTVQDYEHMCRTMNACAGHERRKGMMGKEENIEKGDLQRMKQVSQKGKEDGQTMVRKTSDV